MFEIDQQVRANQGKVVGLRMEELVIDARPFTAEVDAINRAADKVNLLGEKFTILVGRMSTLANVINLGKLIKLPQVLFVVAGIQLALLTVLVYSGYDYIGFREPRFPNLTKGVAEVIEEAVVAPA